MLWFIYNIMFAIGYTLMLPHFLLRMWRRGGYRQDFLQRFGTYAPEVEQKLRDRRRIWIHAVSVGEMQIADLRGKLGGNALLQAQRIKPRRLRELDELLHCAVLAEVVADDSDQ